MREADGFHAVRTGVRSNGMNGATSTRFDPASASSLVSDTIDWFRESKLPATWLCAEAADALGSVLIAAGCKAETAAWEMRAQLADLDLGAAPQEAAEVRRVLSERDLDGWLAVAAECLNGSKTNRTRTQRAVSTPSSCSPRARRSACTSH